MTRFFPLLILFMLGAVLTFALLQKPRHEIFNLSGDAIHKKLPALNVTTREGKSQKLTTDGVTWINFFASWCTSCVEDHHELLALAHDQPQLNMQAIAWNDTVSNIDDWLAQHRNPFQDVWFDTKGKAAMALGVRGMPENFLIDKHGFIRYRIPGPLTPEVRTQVIEPLLAQLMEEP